MLGHSGVEARPGRLRRCLRRSGSLDTTCARWLACLETAEALGWVKPLEPELAALFHRVIGTLVRLVEPKG